MALRRSIGLAGGGRDARERRGVIGLAGATGEPVGGWWLLYVSRDGRTLQLHKLHFTKSSK